jgi:DNA integrity scanning protein DisA with diadenylate cyclase activity
MKVPEAVVKAGMGLANNINARAVMLVTETGETLRFALRHNKGGLPMIVATPRVDTYNNFLKKRHRIQLISLPTRRATGVGQIEDAVASAFNRGLLHEDDLIVAIGSTIAREADSLLIYKVKKEVLGNFIYSYLKKIGVKQDVFETILEIALELGREGRGGRLIGTAFLIGGSEEVMRNSKQLILNPFEGQDSGERMISNPELRESIKELAQLDGAFVVTGEGRIEAAGRYLTANTRVEDIPRGLGARHAAVGGVTAMTNSLGITVSQSGGIVRIFKKGKIIMTIEPRRRIILREEIKKR